MLVEEQHKDKAHLTEINFREMSPADTDASLNVSKDRVSRGQSVAVPGYLSGIVKAHGLFGKCVWFDFCANYSCVRFTPICKTRVDFVTIFNSEKGWVLVRYNFAMTGVK